MIGQPAGKGQNQPGRRLIEAQPVALQLGALGLDAAFKRRPQPRGDTMQIGSAVTGENLHVDAGYHVVGMKAEDAPDIVVPQKNES